ncbi:MAG: hypothetical protein K6B28_12265 [Lachnospiraceae bacterium]|nr:hypothetical protein [Lachnospiraceae bacterium]
MTDLLVIMAGVLFNFILYLAFGSLILYKKGSETSMPVRIVTGFFCYYSVFFVFCLPVMKFYRPLSMLTSIWTAVVVIVIALSLFLDHKVFIGDIKRIIEKLTNEPVFFVIFLILLIFQIVVTALTYNFTLDAAYYVAGVSTNIDTNMINVYDPFTGAWQDHFEMRYFFATYPVQDAVVCQLTGISPLIWTKSVMSMTIIILINLIYYLIVNKLFCDDSKAKIISLAMILFINLTFNTIYTSSTFLFTRTYEGKTIAGNIAILFIFYMFIAINDGSEPGRSRLILFLTCLGASTVSSTANMLIPVEMTVLFIPLIIRKRLYKMIPGYLLCILPGIILALAFVLYVKGYFVFYTYPR